ncbi:MAG: transketolase, partial [Oscillospiraceae bacterium]
MTSEKRCELLLFAAKARLLALKMVHTASSGHIGGSLSSIDLLSALYVNHMRIDTENPSWSERDRFVLSKGHCTPAL